MQVEKQEINIGKTIFEGEIKTSADGKLIVPDVKPDILKVLQVFAEPYLCEKVIEDGKVTLNGKTKINVLYLPEGEICNVMCLDTVFDFCETIKNADFREDMTLCAVCDVEKVSYNLLNSRKIGIEANIIIDVSVLSSEKILMVSNDALEDAEKLKKTIPFTISESFGDFKFNITEDIELPQGMKVCEILKTDISISDKEYKALPEKLVLKGKLIAGILYLDENNKVSHLDYDIPFTEVFEIKNLNDDSEIEINYEIGETTSKITGENSICVSANVMPQVKVSNSEEKEVLCDCYFLNDKCNLTYETIKMQEVLCRPNFSTVLKQLLQKEEKSPDILGVYKVQAKPWISDATIQNGKIMVSGKVLMYVLYIADSTDMPVCVIKEEVPFNYSVECSEKASSDDKVILDVFCEHISYTISSKESVEVRCGLQISGKVIKIFDEKVISDVETEALERKDSGITIYFIRGDESIWDIGKNYNVRQEDILFANEIEGEVNLTKGEKLIIPIS